MHFLFRLTTAAATHSVKEGSIVRSELASSYEEVKDLFIQILSVRVPLAVGNLLFKTFFNVEKLVFIVFSILILESLTRFNV